MNKQSITIGIPAFNEQANIGYLLEDLLKQKFQSLILKKILVISDGSKDKTVEVVKSVKAKKGVITIISYKARKGRAERQNEIMKKADTNVLVLLDADVLITDPLFLEKISKPILHGADLTSVRVEEIVEKNWMGKILAESMDFKRTLFERVNRGNNLYTCHGRARAFSKRLYKQIKFKESVGEDAYSYLYTRYCGFKYKFVKNTQIFYKLPETFSDHEKQSIRFFKAQKKFTKEFGSQFLDQENFLSTPFIVTNFFTGMFSRPYLAAYVIIATYLKIKSFISEVSVNQWAVSETSKKIRNAI